MAIHIGVSASRFAIAAMALISGEYFLMSEAKMRPTSIVDLNVVPLIVDPFHHVVKTDFIRSDAYDEIKKTFPNCPPSTGPTGFSLYWGDPEYDRLISENWAWKSLFGAFHSQSFVDYCMAQFAEVFHSGNFLIDVSRATYVPYCESREDKERRHISRVTHDPHELWVRLDIHEGKIGYLRGPHLDHRRRLITMLIYCCDSDEIDMQGGQLVLLPESSGGESNQADQKIIVPRHNLMALFACGPQSLHSIPKVHSASSTRRTIQVHLSSSVDAWPEGQNHEPAVLRRYANAASRVLRQRQLLAGARELAHRVGRRRGR